MGSAFLGLSSHRNPVYGSTKAVAQKLGTKRRRHPDTSAMDKARRGLGIRRCGTLLFRVSGLGFRV